ncbi:hypothetical protein JW964_05575, partial [candidate division KSB1 bacterium]|nr:hypothetical protein [candidate division KSB1 bacterium]
MSPSLLWLTGISLLGLLVISVVRFIRSRKLVSFLCQLLLLSVAFGFIYRFFYSLQTVAARGENELDIYFVIVLYIFMLLGMLANYLYHRFSQPAPQRKENKFDFGLFFAPIFASPIIFIPLFAALQNAEIDFAHLTT